MGEYLSKDILEESHIRSFAPFHWFQIALGTCRVDARDRFVTPPTALQKVYSLAIIVVTFILFVIIIQYNYAYLLSYRNLYYLCYVAILLNFLIYFANTIHVRFFYNDMNVEFYIKMQEIDRKLKVDTNPYLCDTLYKVNIITVILWTCITSISYLISMYIDFERTISFIGLFYAQFACMTEWIHYSNLILYLYSRIRFINTIIMNHLKIDDESYIKTFDILKFLNKETISDLAAEKNNFQHSDTVVCLEEIFDALRTFTVLYRFQMFLFCFKIVAFTMLYVEFFLLATQHNVTIEEERIFLPIITLGDLLLLTFICIRWEAFFGEIAETKHLCTSVLATHKEGPLRKKAAKMLKAIEDTPPCFSVYDMWHMDASTLLRMLNIITTVMVTLFQFALL